MVVLSDKRVIANLQRRIAVLENECKRNRLLLEIAREQLRKSEAPDAKIALAKLNGIITT